MGVGYSKKLPGSFYSQRADNARNDDPSLDSKVNWGASRLYHVLLDLRALKPTLLFEAGLNPARGGLFIERRPRSFGRRSSRSIRRPPLAGLRAPGTQRLVPTSSALRFPCRGLE